MDLEPPRILRWLLPIGILLVTFAVHAPSIQNDFVFDDRSTVKAFNDEKGRKHEMIAELQPLAVYFTSHYLRGAASSGRNYRPLTVLSYALTFHLFAGGELAKDSPVPHHVINVILQTLNTWLVLLILGRLCPGWPAWAGALVFGVHAIHSEAVAGIVGRGELLGFGFGAASLLLYLRGVERPGGVGWLALIGAGFVLLLAFWSKEGALAWLGFLPMVRIAQHLMQPNPRLGRDLRAAVLLGVIPAALFLGCYIYVTGSSDAGDYRVSYLTNPLAYADPLTRVRTAVVVWGFAVYKTIAPFSLACDYGANVFTLARSFTDYRVWLSLASLLALVAFGLRGARRQPMLFLAMACFFGFSVIVSNVPLAQETIFAERNYYTPSLALSFVVAWLLGRPMSGTWRRLSVAGVVAWCVACSIVDLQRMGDWRDNDTLFVHDMNQQPRSLRLLDTAADAYRSRGDRVAYQQVLERQLELEPAFPKALLRLGAAAMRRGDLEAAEQLFRRCRESRLLLLIDRTNNESRLYCNLGILMASRGEPDQAAGMFERSMQVDPAYLKPRFMVVRKRIDDGRLADALELIEAGELHDPGHPGWQLQRGKIAWRQGRPAAAERLLRAALQRLEFSFQTLDDWLDLVDAILRQGRREEAMRVLDDALRKGGDVVPPASRARVERLRSG